MSLIVRAALAACLASGANAATLTAQYSGGTGGVDSPYVSPQPDKGISDYVETTDMTLSIGDSASAVGSFGSGAISAQLSANAKTGEIKTLLKAERTGEASTGDKAPIPYLHSDISMTEEFILNGTGTFTVYALVDAVWSAPQLGFSFVMNTWGMQTGHDYYHVDTSGLPGNDYYHSISPTGSVTDHLLKASVDIYEAVNQSQMTSLTLNASLATWSWDAFLDASHTAQFYFETTGDLTATPTTPGFLSESTFGLPQPAPIPLPAGLPLLGAGLLAFGGLRLSTRRKT